MGAGWRRFAEKVGRHFAQRRLAEFPPNSISVGCQEPARLSDLVNPCIQAGNAERRIKNTGNHPCRTYVQAKQKWHITLDRGFPATTNLRNEAMMHDAAEFAVHLKRCEKDIRTLKNATEGARSAQQHSARVLTQWLRLRHTQGVTAAPRGQGLRTSCRP